MGLQKAAVSTASEVVTPFGMMIVVFLFSLVINQAEAFGRYAVAKQHESPSGDIITSGYYPQSLHNITEEWPKAKEVLAKNSQTHQDLLSSKFDLELEGWLLVAFVFGAVLAIVVFQLVRLVRHHLWNADLGSSSEDISRIESGLRSSSTQLMDSIISEGLDTVSRTKKVVVMNIHFVPCDGDCRNTSSQKYSNDVIAAAATKVLQSQKTAAHAGIVMTQKHQASADNGPCVSV